MIVFCSPCIDCHDDAPDVSSQESRVIFAETGWRNCSSLALLLYLHINA